MVSPPPLPTYQTTRRSKGVLAPLPAAVYSSGDMLLCVPRSACLDPSLSFPDWVCHSSAPVFDSAAAPPSEVVPFLVESGFLAYGEYGLLLSSSPVPAGKIRLLMGPCGYADDMLSLRPLMLPLLREFVELPLVNHHGSAPGVALAPALFVDLLQLLMLSVEVQFGLLPSPPVSDDEEDDE